MPQLASVGKSVRNETGTGMKSKKKKKEFNTSNLKKKNETKLQQRTVFVARNCTGKILNFPHVMGSVTYGML